MRLPGRRVRRTLLPIELIVLILLIAVFALATLVTAIVAPFSSRRRPVRIAAFGLSYCVMEVLALVAIAGLWLRRPHLGSWHAGSENEWTASHQALLAWVLGRVLSAARFCFGFTVIDDSRDPPALMEDEPVLVLARHAGPGDSFALTHLLLTKYRRHVRIVLKDILQLDPVLDLLLNRLGGCFLPSARGAGEDLSDRLAEVARQLGRGEALLIFPEGGNWTPDRRRRAIRHLRQNDDRHAARAAALMTNVLPPRFGGVLACLNARPELPVVIVAHAGLDRIVRPGQAWAQLPLTTPMLVKAWPAAATPDLPSSRQAWLTAEWAVLDEWVDGYHANPRLATEHPLPPPAGRE